MKARKRKTFSRRMFVGDIRVRGDRAVLTVRRGAHRRTVDELGDFIDEVFEPTATLWANVGDLLMVHSGQAEAVENIAIVEIIGIEPNGATFRARITKGQVARPECVVQIQPIKRDRRAA